MSRLKILLISPFDSTYRYKKGNFGKSVRYASITLTTLAALVPEYLKAEIKIIDEGVEYFNGRFDADLVGISAVTASADRAYYLAGLAKKSGITTVLGGSHPTLMPQEAVNHADAIVVGFAEESWPKLLADWQKGRLKKIYHQRKNLILENLPFPRRDLLKRNAYLIKNTIITSRGCPCGCTFCAIPEMWGKGFYHRPLNDVIEEIKRMPSKKILFLDPNLNGDKLYFEKLLDLLIPLKIQWAGLATINVAEDDNLLKKVKDSGCIGLLIGFESVEQLSLNQYGKRFNNVSDYKEYVGKLHQNKIRVMGCFVFGFDNEDKSIFQKTIDFVKEIDLDLVRYSILTPFPGTAIFNQFEKENRILTKNWSRYNQEEVVFEPKNMTTGELQAGLYFAWKNSYDYSSIIKKSMGAKRNKLLTLIANFGLRKYAYRLEKCNLNR